MSSPFTLSPVLPPTKLRYFFCSVSVISTFLERQSGNHNPLPRDFMTNVSYYRIYSISYLYGYIYNKADTD